MRKESECEFCELCREFYEGKKKECKGPEHCKDYNYFLAGKCAALEGRLKFGGCKDAAPFPSMVVIFGKEKEHEETEHAGSRGTGKEEA